MKLVSGHLTPPNRPQILVVCAGNVCRSPLATGLLDTAFRAAPGQPIDTHSAGTQALVGSAPTPQTQARLAAQGIDASGFVARQLTADMVAYASLVLTASRAQRGAVLTLLPAANRRCFTLREFARILPTVVDQIDDAAPAQRLLRAVDLVASHRGFLPPAEPADLDIVDPYGRSDAVYEQMAGQLVPAVQTIVAGVLDGARAA